MSNTIYSKCDCCGKRFPVNELKLVVNAKKEFDGAACEKCVIELKNK